MKDFRDLFVWRKSHELTLALYKVTAKFPDEEKFGLRSQIRRCCASIPANIAEGCGKKGGAEFNRFLLIASGSGSELEYHLLFSHDLGYISAPDHSRLRASLLEVRRMLTGLITKVEKERNARVPKC